MENKIKAEMVMWDDMGDKIVHAPVEAVYCYNDDPKVIEVLINDNLSVHLDVKSLKKVL